MVSNVGDAGIFWQAESDFYLRISGGYLTEGISGHTDLPMPVQHLAEATPARVAQFERFVKADKVGAILLDARQKPTWAGIFRKVSLVGYTAGGVIVYPTNGCQSCHPVTAAQLH